MTTPNNPYGNDQNNDSNQGLPSYGDSRPGANDAQGQHAGEPGAGYGGSQYQGGFENAPNFEKSKLALAVLIIGIVALVGLLVGGLGALLGVVGVVLAIVALVRNAKKPKEARRTWMSVVGLILSLISVAVGVLMVLFIGWFFNEANFEECLSLQDEQAQRECIERQSEELVNSSN